ncbi:MAG: Holliday junction resolvase RuvX [Candidatus Sungbacteria bacterium]|uniref:Putative pre-16S rRNA nuclease n=1 Tax=Candidatus Sungiibacteriota bacterium TaxID=2750080 RepID=A0A932QYD2_9BACT|nr:Holliday junction resolvase RuvX [Candidatus Sungbacteria bacterium]
MRYLGIDYGRRRIGVAYSDEEGRIAFPDRVIAAGRDEAAIKEIVRLVSGAGAKEIVIGLPLGLDGKETEESGRVRAFARSLGQAAQLPVHLENEILTSRMATHVGVAKEMRDAASAAFILQSYLDKENRS